uniref:Procollagen C-endopeptidase enhancer 2b n=1 Tax=Oreochromis aureus TaxID=47969 RepID=A0A668UAU3_OREAU
MPFTPRGENRRSSCSVFPTMWRTCSIFCAWTVLFLTEVCAQSQQRPIFTCGGNITEESGVIGSQGYPGVYPPNTKCVWRITVPEGKVVVLSFRFIDLENDNLCRYDYVDVYSGHVNGQRLGRFCGTFKPGALVSTGNKMLLQMVSDANTAGSGFLAVFSAAHSHERGDQYCGGRLLKPSGTFKTPNWPEKDYPAGVTCSWHIVAPKNQIIEVKFEKFDVERDNYCRYDHVSIFNGPEINDVISVMLLLSRAALQAGVVGGESRLIFFVCVSFSLCAALKYSVALCRQKCKRRGTLESNYCSSDFVITGTVITAVIRGGSMHATVSIINVYKEGNLAIQQAGKTMSTKIVILCKKCPVIRRGLNYIFMGQVDEEGRGKIAPHHFVMAFKTKNQKGLNVLKNKQC